MRRKLSFDDEKDLVLLGKALSSEIRIKILNCLTPNLTVSMKSQSF